MKSSLICTALIYFIVCCISKKKPIQEEKPIQETVTSVPKDLANEAKRLSKEFIIIDGHVDLPYRLRNKMQDISVQTSGGHFDYVRAKKGGLDAPFMSIFIPATFENNGAMQLAQELIVSVEKLCIDHPDKFALAKSPQDIKNNFANNLISLPMGLENGAPVEGKLDNLNILFGRGIRYITLTHAKDNHISDSSYDQKYTHGGLSPFGHKVIERMNQLGIMVDISHVSDSAFYQAVRISKAPVIATHSSCRHFTPGFERNVSDDMIRLIGDNNGIIMINFGSMFLTQKGQGQVRELQKKLKNNPDDLTIKAELDSLKKSHLVLGNVALVVDHIDHVVEIAGIDHVGLGSDFDGVGQLPIGLDDASKLPNLIHELLKRDYSASDIEKICSENLFRVWDKVIEIAG